MAGKGPSDWFGVDDSLYRWKVFQSLSIWDISVHPCSIHPVHADPEWADRQYVSVAEEPPRSSIPYFSGVQALVINHQPLIPILRENASKFCVYQIYKNIPCGLLYPSSKSLGAVGLGAWSHISQGCRLLGRRVGHQAAATGKGWKECHPGNMRAGRNKPWTNHAANNQSWQKSNWRG